MRKYLIPEGGKFYKANLHTHTTVSDGKLTPAEIKEEYMKRGYSIVAYTDHNIMIPHPELQDENFLPITGIEIDINDEARWKKYQRTYHLNMYSPDINRSVTRVFCERFVSAKEHMRPLVTDEMRAHASPDRVYTKEYAQSMVDLAIEEGCLVSYNHPVWSLQSKEDYSGMKGFFGVEWLNTGGDIAGYIDTMQPLYDLWREGERMCYPLATDDCHSMRTLGKSFVMVKAENLEYSTVFEALRRGEFYSSAGPLIEELYIEDKKLYVKVDKATKVVLTTDHRFVSTVGNGIDPLTEAVIPLDIYFEDNQNRLPEDVAWIRLDVIDENGKYARTRAYFIDEITE